MAKEIVFNTDKLAAGVDKLANAVKITMGPKGRTVVIEKSYGAPAATKDGVTVAKAVSLPDPQENIGARMIQEVAKKAGDDAGDGTTTATVLAQKLIREGRRVIAAGMNPMDIKRGIDIATAAVVADIDKHARPVKTAQKSPRLQQFLPIQTMISVKNRRRHGKSGQGRRYNCRRSKRPGYRN